VLLVVFPEKIGTSDGEKTFGKQKKKELTTKTPRAPTYLFGTQEIISANKFIGCPLIVCMEKKVFHESIFSLV
jgi:hypothetical protein